MGELSAIVITYNEEKNIEQCLKSLQQVADEIIVVDSFSTDQTEAICRRMNVRFVTNKFVGYGDQKQFATEQATNNWVLSLDADEVLSTDLIKSINECKSDICAHDGYSFNRRNHFCEVPIKFCGWYPDKSVRLYDKTKINWTSNLVHETISCPKTAHICHLNGDLLHYTYESEAEHLAKARSFAKLAATELAQKNIVKPRIVVLAKAAFRFFKTFILRLGFLDGRYGFLISVGSAKFVYWKYSERSKYLENKL